MNKRGRPKKGGFKEMPIPPELGGEQPRIEISDKKDGDANFATANKKLNALRTILTNFDSRVGDLNLYRDALSEDELTILGELAANLDKELDRINDIVRNKKPAQAINYVKKEHWAIVGGFSYPDRFGVTYNLNVGEPVPDNMSESDAQNLWKEGKLARVRLDGSFEKHPSAVDMDAQALEMYMKDTDKQLIYKIKNRPHTIDTLIRMLDITKTMNYNQRVIDCIKEKIEQMT